jgi:uncharacterized protein YndB with AHSA1/START domain
MTEPVVHSSFTVERTLPAPPAKVFAAFADADRKAAWFHGPDDWRPTESELDFREGGREVAAGGVPGAWTSRFEATYHAIEADSLIAYTYVMYHDDVRLSVSVATVELEEVDGGAATRLSLTEQGAYFVGGESANAEREEGTIGLMENLASTL